MAPYLQLPRVVLICVLLLIIDVHAKCVNPSVRREWRQLSQDERADWIDAVRCLNKLPHDPALTPSVDPSISQIPPVNTSGSFWDDISYLHMDLNYKIHFTGLFLPWHRTFVWGLERALRTKCNFHGVQPYWDWTIDAPDFYHATILDNNTKSGFGGWGDPNNDFQITTGGFAKDFIVSYPSPHSIRRNFILQPFLDPAPFPGPPPPANTAEDINTTFTEANAIYSVESFVGDYESFQAYFESIEGLHPGPHIILGGDMIGSCPSNTPPADCVPGPKWTPNDPLFFMHHAMVDRIWYLWQKKHAMNQYAYHGGSIPTATNATLYAEFPNGAPPFLNFDSPLPSDGLLWDNVTIWDVMDTTSGILCYVYE
jgi:tyrosinase